MKNLRKSLSVKPLLAAAVLAIGVIAVAGPANAAWSRGRDWHEHVIHNHAYYVGHPHYVPGYVVAPPPVVYAPPPPSPGINLILPLNFH